MWIAAVAARAEPPPGHVTLPLADWERTAPQSAPPPAPQAVLPIGRTLRGRIDRGLLSARVVSRFEVLGGPRDVPVVAAGTALSGATLDGRPASAALVGERWVVRADPGVHELEVGLLHGERTERFGRSVRLELGPGGPAAFDLVVPEAPIVPTLRGGVLTGVAPHPDGTRLTGWLDAAGTLDLAWERRPTHALDPAAARTEVRAHAIFDLTGDVVVGRARYDVRVREGEVDRYELHLPDEVEVVEVSGSSVLQWHTEAGGELVVLLRHVADEAFDATVSFQYPTRPEGEVALLLPTPDAEVAFAGALGVVAPVGLEVVRSRVERADVLEPRDVPRELLALTGDPLRSAAAFRERPEVAVTVSRRPDVAVSPTRIDDLQGISVLVEDGTEVGKLRLTVRNTARQVLTVDLPPGARLTHCFRDGSALRPAADAARPERVLVPLTRSERAEQAAQAYVVRAGDTLSGVALDNYGDGSAWRGIALANALSDAGQLRVGQVLHLPAAADAPLEQAFVLELGWERHTAPLAPIGVRTVALPTLDLEVMDATWHLYLPGSLEPLTLSGTLPALEELHPDPLSRALHLLASAELGGAAWAGDGYRSVLSSRRDQYEQKQRAQADAGVDPFPLVGRRWRFHGVLPGTTAPSARVAYLSSTVADGVRAATALAAAGLAFLASRRSGWARLAAAAGLVVGLVVAHHVLGVHRRMVWGADAGLAAALAARWLGGARFERPSRWWALALLAVPVLLLRWDLVPVGIFVAVVLAHGRLR